MDGDVVDAIDIDERMFAARVIVAERTLRDILPNDCGMADMVRFVATRRHLFATTYAMNDPSATTTTRHVVVDTSPLVADALTTPITTSTTTATASANTAAAIADDDIELPPSLDSFSLSSSTSSSSSSSLSSSSSSSSASASASAPLPNESVYVSESYSITLVQSVWKFGSNAVHVELAFARDAVLRTRFVQRSSAHDDSGAFVDTFVAPLADVDGHAEHMDELDRAILASVR